MLKKSDIKEILEQKGIKIENSNDSIMKILHENLNLVLQESECQKNQKTT
jgi:hypothetical protein